MLITHPNDILRQISTPVDKADHANLAEWMQEMANVMKLGNGIGISAPQIGVIKRIIGININDPRNAWTGFMINPVVLSKSEDCAVANEGCLSFPKLFLPVTRSSKITVEYLDLSGNTKIRVFSGLVARCILHEIDHLDGVLLIDQQDK